MPLPAIIAAVGAIGGSLINSSNQSSINAQNIKFQSDLYDRQYKDSINFWNMQNAYNSPAAQMKRYAEAGLNPYLAQTGGQPGNAQSIGVPDARAPELRSPDWGNAISNGLGMLSAFADLKMKAAQTDNLLAQNTVIQEDAMLRAVQRRQMEALTERSVFDLDFAKELRTTDADARRELLRQLQQSIDLAANKDEREAVANATNVQEALERMLSLRDSRLTSALSRDRTVLEMKGMTQEQLRTLENIRLLKQQGVLNALEIALKKKGLTWSDPLWTRVVHEFGNRAFESQTWKELKHYDWKPKKFSPSSHIREVDSLLQRFLLPPGARQK